MQRFKYRGLLLSVAIVVMGACSNNALTTTPTTSPCPCTDSFSGTLSTNGAFSHTFTITTLGSVTASIVSLSPTRLDGSAQLLGFGLGVWNGSSCTVASSSDTATAGSTITLNASAAGTLCVRVYDVGFITTPVLYQLQVVHP